MKGMKILIEMFEGENKQRGSPRLRCEDIIAIDRTGCEGIY